MSDEKKVNKVTKGEVGVHKRSPIFNVKNDLELEDNREVLSYVLTDLLWPKLKDLVGDILKGAIDKKLYGATYRPRERERDRNGSSRYHVSYDRSSSRDRVRSADSDYCRNTSYEDITFDERPDADNVLDGLCQLIEDYNQATIGDLYDLAGYTPDENFQKNESFGWKNLSSARVVRVHNYYMLDLPRARYLD